MTVEENADQTITFTPNEGYALDSVTVDGELASLTDGSYTFRNVTGGHSIKVVYAEDEIGGTGPENPGDSIPDKYQAVVTFKVENGSFDDGFDQVQTLSFKTYDEERGAWVDVDPLPWPSIPSDEKDMRASGGYHTGDNPWGTADPNTATFEAEKNYEFTYTYVIDTYTVTVKVENGTAKDVATELAASGELTVDKGADKTLTFAPKLGYALDTVTVDDEPAILDENGSYTFEDITSDHTIEVVYAEDKIGGTGPEKPGDGIPDKYQATVTYEVEDGTWADGAADPVKQVVTFKDAEGNYVEPGTVDATHTALAVPQATSGAGYGGGSWNVASGSGALHSETGAPTRSPATPPSPARSRGSRRPRARRRPPTPSATGTRTSTATGTPWTPRRPRPSPAPPATPPRPWPSRTWPASTRSPSTSRSSPPTAPQRSTSTTTATCTR